MADTPNSASDTAALKRALVAVKDLRGRLDRMERSRQEPIAIIGMSCRFPGRGDSIDGFWQLLRAGESAITEVPPDRWDIDAYYDPDQDRPGRMYARHGGFLRGIDQFDPRFFGISPREAQSMDPQQRLLLEVSWEALEDASQSPADLAGTLTGVFVGISVSDYGALLSAGQQARDLYAGTGNALSIAAGRLAYTLGLNGPAMAVDTACSSALASVHLAMRSLRQGECRVAIAGGVNAILSPEGTILACRGHMLSPDGRCKTFDASADGYVRGEGCGMIVLKRLSDAESAGDRILAVLRGSAVNQDGKSSGLTVPNGPAQEALIRAALIDAGMTAGDIAYHEAHGTGTNLGDPIEVRAIQAVHGGRTEPLRVGSVKTNIGHLEPAAGIAGVIKVVQSLVHEEIPPHLNFSTPNPQIVWDTGIEVPTSLTPWPRTTAKPRAAGVSAFGFSGTNVHVIVEEAPAIASERTSAAPASLLTLSARSEPALRRLAGAIGERIDQTPDLRLEDVCFSLNVGRSAMEQRASLVAESIDALRTQLAALADGEAVPAVSSVSSADRPRIAFIYTGQGSQYAGMGRELFDTQPVFRAAVEECHEALGMLDGHRLIDLLYGRDGDHDALLEQTGRAQPAIFAIGYALTRLWRSWGVEPAAVMGHSVGEIAAACAAGIYSVNDALALVAARARLMQGLPAGGGMLAVTGAEAAIAQEIRAAGLGVSMAAVNGPEDVVLSGSLEALRNLEPRLAAAGLATKFLKVSHAFHSPLMEPIAAQLEAAAEPLTFNRPSVRLISNLTGQPVSAEAPMNAAYWRAHLLGTVRFGASLDVLLQKHTIFLELGPHPILSTLGRKLRTSRPIAWLPSLRRGKSDWRQMLDTAGDLFLRGVRLDAAGLAAPGSPRKISLPTYPFQRSSFWLDTRTSAASRRAVAMPGTPVRSAKTGEIVCETELSAAEQPFLADHTVFGTVIFPAAGYITLALGAAVKLGAGVRELSGVSLHQPLLFAQQERRTVQTVLAPAEKGAWQLSVHSRPAGEEEAVWTQHVSGRLTVLPADTAIGDDAVDPDSLQHGRRVSSEDFYATMAGTGIAYGPTYTCLSEIHVVDGAAAGRVTCADPESEHTVHPAMLDALFQTFGAASTAQSQASAGGVLFLPIGFTRLRTTASFATGKTLRAAARVTSDASTTGETIQGNVWCFDARGEVALTIEGFTARRATKDALLRALRKDIGDWIYEVAWRTAPPAAVDAASPKVAAGGHWVLLADGGGVAAALAEGLPALGVSATLVFKHGAADPPAGATVVDAASSQDIARALTEAAGKQRGRLDGVALLWALDERRVDVAAATREVVAEAVSAVQAALGLAAVPRLMIVTRGAQPAGSADAYDAPASADPAQAALWGLARVLAVERPETACRVLDLPVVGSSGAAADTDAAFVASELAGTGAGELQVAYRGGERRVPRLVRSPAARVQGGVAVPDGASALTIRSRGVLEALEFTPIAEREPAPGEVKIRLTASALNFRDVLNALGMYPGDPGAIGSEVVGEVVAVGSGVTTLAAGDRVMAIADRAFSTYTYAPVEMTKRVPAALTDEEAATIPAAYLTAHYALSRVANLKAGERVLIHAAAGGVGLAAVQLALRAGAEVFATAGSPAKRDFLRSLGVHHLMDSRTLDFADTIRTITGGTGIDVVLNSLIGEAIPKSMSLLRAGGRFVEIGKIELWTPDQVAAVNPQVTYTVLDLGAECQTRLATVGSVFDDLTAALGEGRLPPLPRHLFALSHVRDAFRFMAQARHTGKVVVVHPPAGQIQSRATYLVTGGASGLGLAAARWMAERGARDIVLISRSAPAADAAADIESMNAAGARVVHVRADVADRAALDAILRAIPRDRPLRGIMHAAGVVDDGAIGSMDRERLERVLAPKVTGAVHLHELTLDTPLDFFVLFSTVAGVFGSAGQANYAAANAALDALAHQRRASGRTATSINWGPWAEVGMAARLGARERERWSAAGVGAIDPVRGIEALQECLRRDRGQMVVVPIDWRQFSQQLNGHPAPPFVSELVHTSSYAATAAPRSSGVTARERLAGSDPAARPAILREYLLEQVNATLGLRLAEHELSQEPLTKMGLDSLMAVELKNRFDTGLGVEISVAELLQGLTIRDLERRLLGGLRDATDSPAGQPDVLTNQLVEEGEF